MAVKKHWEQYEWPNPAPGTLWGATQLPEQFSAVRLSRIDSYEVSAVRHARRTIINTSQRFRLSEQLK